MNSRSFGSILAVSWIQNKSYHANDYKFYKTLTRLPKQTIDFIMPSKESGLQAKNIDLTYQTVWNFASCRVHSVDNVDKILAVQLKRKKLSGLVNLIS